MKKLTYCITRRCIAGLAAFVMTTGAWLTVAAAAQTPQLDINSDAYVVADAATGQILIEKNMNKRKAPASITKILTLSLALERGGIMTDRITVSQSAINAVEPGSTHIALVPGEQITFRDAVMGTQLISANDAANVIAEYVSGSMETFVQRMNSKVAELGLTGSHFANPSGLDANQHYVTAYDMAQITRYALTVPGFREIFGATKYQMPETNIKARNWEFFAQNAIMFPENREYYEGIEGSKLGYTHAANHTLVAVAQRGDMELIVVALDSKGASAKYSDAAKLLDYCFERYGMMTLGAKELKADPVPIASLQQPTGMVQVSSKNDHTFPVPLGTQKSSLRIEYNLPELYKSERNIDPSFSVYTADGQLVYTAPLEHAIKPVEVPVALPDQQSVPKNTQQLNAIMLVAFKCLLVAMAVFVTLFFICRCVIIFRYYLRRRAKYKKKLEALKRRELAIQRSALELKKLEADFGRPIPDNVTHIYPNRSRPIPPRRVSRK